MATNLPSCFSIQFLEQLLKFLVNFTLLKYVKSQRNYGFLITKELIFGFQILDLKDHFSASLSFSDKRPQNEWFLLQLMNNLQRISKYPLEDFGCCLLSKGKYSEPCFQIDFSNCAMIKVLAVAVAFIRRISRTKIS